LGSIPREGFETAMQVHSSEAYIAVQAKHSSGRVLGASSPLQA
jgi:hypothetical protein